MRSILLLSALSVFSLLPHTSLAQGVGQEVVSFDETAKIARLNLIAGADQTNNGLNFNGYANGNMRITVPLGWTVEISFLNGHQGGLHHAVAVVSSKEDFTSGAQLTPAFPGAVTTRPGEGLPGGARTELRFVADKAGEYFLICPVGNHAQAGMWVRFVVSDEVKTPAIGTPE